MGARGNATSFPLPWSSLLSELVGLDALHNAGEMADLPWAAEQLADQVSMLLKTFDDDETESMANVIHQALVRRNVVLQLIQGAKDRGHRAYVNVNMDRAKEKAKQLTIIWTKSWCKRLRRPCQAGRIWKVRVKQ